jgi:hypothetical protein
MIHYEDLEDYEFVQTKGPMFIGIDPWLETSMRIKYDNVTKRLTFLQLDIVGRELSYTRIPNWQKDTNNLVNELRDKTSITYAETDKVSVIINDFFINRYHPIGMIYISSIKVFSIMSNDKGVPWKVVINDFEFRIDKKVEK